MGTKGLARLQMLQVREHLKLELGHAIAALDAINIDGAGELAPDVFGVRGMANDQAERLSHQASPLRDHVVAAKIVGQAARHLDAAANSAGLGPDMRSFIYSAAHLLGQAHHLAQAADRNRLTAAKDRQPGLVKAKVNELIRQHPNSSGSAIAALLTAQTGKTVSTVYVNVRKRKMKTDPVSFEN